MTRSLPDTPEQLRLFQMLDAPVVRPRMRARARRGRGLTFRLGASLLALGVATAGILGGSFAAWTAQTTNPANQVTAGTLAMTNDKAATALFSADNVKPGDTGSQTVTVTNTGSIPMSVKLTQDQVTTSGIETSLGLKVHDQTRNWCYWPVSQAGACPAAHGAWNAAPTLLGFVVPATDGSSRWPAGQSHTFTISWELAPTSPNSDQGKTGSFRLVWDGTQ